MLSSELIDSRCFCSVSLTILFIVSVSRYRHIPITAIATKVEPILTVFVSPVKASGDINIIPTKESSRNRVVYVINTLSKYKALNKRLRTSK